MKNKELPANTRNLFISKRTVVFWAKICYLSAILFLLGHIAQPHRDKAQWADNPLGRLKYSFPEMHYNR